MLYYEAHITIDPVFDETRQQVTDAATPHGFHMARLLMRKSRDEPATAHADDSFLTARSQSLPDITAATQETVAAIQALGVCVRRYKIEDILLDSRIKDVLGLLSRQA